MELFEFLRLCRYKQYFCVITVSLLQVCVSMSGSWISPVLSLLTSDKTPLETTLTNFEESWVVSGEKLGSLVGCIIAAYLTDKIGRKRILLLSAIPFCVSMMGATLAKTATVFIILRFIGGLGTGIVFVKVKETLSVSTWETHLAKRSLAQYGVSRSRAVPTRIGTELWKIISVLPIYVGEIADKDIRGRLNVLRIILGTLGSVYVYSVGPFISYIVLSITCGIVPIVFALIFVFMPESPHFLIKTCKVAEATESLRQLSQKNLNEEALISRLQDVQRYVDNDVANKITLKEVVFNKAYRKAILITLVLNTILIASGGFVISGYLQKIIDNSDSSISPQISSVIFGTVKLPSVLLAAFLVDKCGRRPLLIISSGGSAIALIAEGVYFYLKEQKQDVSVISWLPTTGLSLYLLFSYFGIHVIPSVVLGEIFTINVKSAAASGVSVYISALSFLLFQFFNPLSNLLGIYTMFWIFAGVCVFGVLFGVLIMIETKGKSFIEIQQLLITNEKGQNSCEVTKDGDSNGVKLNSI